MNEDRFYGMLWGQVRDVKDPLGLNRVKAYVPALGDPKTTGWLYPMGWPGGGGDTQGSMYPMQLDATVGVFFEQGDPLGKGGYLPGPYGLDGQGRPMSPSYQQQMQISYDAEAARRVATIWEDDFFRMFFDLQPVGQQPDTRRFVIEDKTAFSSFIFDVAAGQSKNSVAISINSATSISINAAGVVDIQGSRVQIQGRPVRPYGGGSKPI